MSTLRTAAIRLAAANPGPVRAALLPILKKAGKIVPVKGPMHIGDSKGTLCGIPAAKAEKQGLRAVSKIDAGRIEAPSSWCPKCLKAAEGIKINQRKTAAEVPPVVEEFMGKWKDCEKTWKEISALRKALNALPKEQKDPKTEGLEKAAAALSSAFGAFRQATLEW